MHDTFANILESIYIAPTSVLTCHVTLPFLKVQHFWKILFLLFIQTASPTFLISILASNQMASKANLVFLLVLSIYATNHGDCAHHHAAVPSPAASVDCSTLVLNMADCLSFVQAGSTVTKPQGSCCSGLKTVLKADAECLCEAFRRSASLGVTLNVTKAQTLPSLCKVSAPSTTNCACEYMIWRIYMPGYLLDSELFFLGIIAFIRN